MINWLYTPGITFEELASKAKAKWDQYYNFVHAPGFGAKDTTESWGAWRAQIRVARAFLESAAIGNFFVQFIVETQLLLRPFLEGRTKMHLIYKVWRADSPQALCNDFKSETRHERRSYEGVQVDAMNEAKQFLAETKDVNCQLQGNNGATCLWLAAEQGHADVVQEILRHPKIDPNKVRLSTKTTPLLIAAYHGHDEVVEALLGHADIQVNVGSTDTGASPLFMAVQEGREGSVEILLRQNNIDANKPTAKGITPLCVAAELGHEHIVRLLLQVADINVRHTLKDGTTAMSTAVSHGHRKTVGMLEAHSTAGTIGSSSTVGDF